MLILTRKQGESIILYTTDGEIEIKVIKAQGTVAVGLQAPDSVNIRRKEIPNIKETSSESDYHSNSEGNGRSWEAREGFQE